MDNATMDAVREVQSILAKIDPFTVGDLKLAIAGLPDDTQVLISGPEGARAEWYNVAKVFHRPDCEEEGGDGYCALTFDLVDNYDGRQF